MGDVAPFDQRAAAQGVDLWALTDHDSVAGQQEARESAQALGLAWVSGVEVSVDFLGQTIHIVGLGVDSEHPGLRALLQHHRNSRIPRAQAMAAGLAAVGIAVTAIDLNKYKVFSMVCYMAIGWCIVFKLPLLIQAIGWGGFLLILGFTVLRTVVPDEDGGILVNFGNVNAAIITSCSFKNVSSMSISYTSTPRTVIPINLGFTSKSPIILNPLLSKSWLFANA